jgi:Mn-dependent DtxR family transcriptional regulator
VRHLGLDVELAHDAACQLEHATPNWLTDRLDAFLGYTQVNATGERISEMDGTLPQGMRSLLTSLSPRQSGRVVRCDIDNGLLAAPGRRPAWLLRAED